MAKRDLEGTRATLTSWLEGKLPGASGVTITGLELPVDGASNETIFFDADWVEDGKPRNDRLVLRVQPDAYQLFFGMDVFHQWRMMEAIGAHSDVPVPEMLWQEPSSAVLGSPFYVMRRVDGQVPNGFHSPMFQELSPEGRRRIYTHGLDAMARVHNLDWRDGFEFLDTGGVGAVGLDRYLGWVEGWYRWAQNGRTFETVEAGLKYLRDHQPKDAPVSVVWGDSRPGNMMFDPTDQRLTAMIDWELASLATPETDLGWWLMFERVFIDGSGMTPQEGIPDRDEILTEYEKFLGRPLGDFNYFDVLAWTRFGITFIRHVDLEMGGPAEAMFLKLDKFVTGCLAEHVAR